MERFEDLIENDCFKLATYLDPVFGPKAFRPEARVQVKERLKLHIGLLNPEIQKASEASNSNKPASSISSNYTFYSEVNKDIETFDDMDCVIEKYTGLVNSSSYTDPLVFWKAHENSLPLLAPLAKKFLGVPASSASVERMFNISGHIFSNKRRRTGVNLFENLTFLKLNESYL